VDEVVVHVAGGAVDKPRPARCAHAVRVAHVCEQLLLASKETPTLFLRVKKEEMVKKVRNRAWKDLKTGERIMAMCTRQGQRCAA
jgi:hypothetical protein